MYVATYMHPAYAHNLYVPYVQKPKDSCLHKIMIKAYLIRGGGRAGYGLNILVYVVPEAIRNGFRDHKFSNFPGEHPLICVVTIILYNSLSNKSCIKT